MSEIKEVEYNFIKPDHYKLWSGMEEFELHKSLLTKEEYIGFLKGNILKYQMRMSRKPGVSIEQDIKKRDFYSSELNKFISQTKINFNG